MTHDELKTPPTAVEIAELVHLLRLHIDPWANILRRLVFAYDLLREQNRALKDMSKDDFWAWQGDGEDHLESLTCPVLIIAKDLQAIIEANHARQEDHKTLVDTVHRLLKENRALAERVAAQHELLARRAEKLLT